MRNFRIWQKLALTAIDLGRRTAISTFLPAFEESQWLPTELLAYMQIVRLQQTLGFACEHVPFYVRLFEQNKFHPDDFRTLSDLERLPIITKDIIRKAPLDFIPQGSDILIPYKSRHTGGSTGEPLEYRVANDAFGMRWAAGLRAWQGAGYTFGDKMLTLGGASLSTPQANKIGQRVYNVLRNNHTISVGRLDVEDLHEIVAQLNVVCPSLLYGYPSILYLVACDILHHEIPINSIKRVITTSEMLFPRQRQLIEQAFHAPVYDHYGCPEAGLIAGECDNHQGMHYAMEICLVEVLDEANHRVPIGHTGRLVATYLLNRAMCLIRYDTGDVGAVTGEKCPCGRGLLQITRLEGRSRDLIYSPTKKFIHAVAINHLIYNYPWVDRYQIVQETSHGLKLNLAVSTAIDPAHLETLRSQVSEYTDMAVTMAINNPFIETNGKKNRLVISKIHIPDVAE